MKCRLHILLLSFLHLAILPAYAGKDTAGLSPAYAPSALIKEELKLRLRDAIREKKKTKLVLGYSAGMLPVELYYFPGRDTGRTLIFGGMHGSELSSVDLAMNLVAFLEKTDAPLNDVLIIPCLYPDNNLKARLLIRDKKNIGAARYSHDQAPDPNRQMPAPGKPFDPEWPFDCLGRPVETEIQLLLQFIQFARPQKIASLHAIRNINQAGFFADPRAGHDLQALGFAADSTVAVEMAAFVCRNGGWVPGNRLDSMPTALYHADPPAVPAGHIQPRNLAGSHLPGGRGAGISLGTWASTGVDPAFGEDSRPPISIFTIEFPGYFAAEHYQDQCLLFNYRLNRQLYTEAIVQVLLQKL